MIPFLARGILENNGISGKTMMVKHKQNVCCLLTRVPKPLATVLLQERIAIIEYSALVQTGCPQFHSEMMQSLTKA